LLRRREKKRRKKRKRRRRRKKKRRKNTFIQAARTRGVVALKRGEKRHRLDSKVN